jgi:hypothetical protein
VLMLLSLGYAIGAMVASHEAEQVYVQLLAEQCVPLPEIY